jgi:uncharacterized protein
MAIKLLVVCVVVFIAGVVDAVAGGGGILTLPTYIAVGIEPMVAMGTNKVVSSCGTALAVYRYWKNGFVVWRSAVFAVMGALIGSLLGTRVLLVLSNETIKLMMLVILPVIAVGLMTIKLREVEDDHVVYDKFKLILVGLLVGFYDGFFGPGAGTFYALGFSLLAQVPILKATGMAKAANLGSNVSAAFLHILAGNVLYWLALPAIICSLAGNWVGTQLAINKGQIFIKLMMLVSLLLIFVKIIIDIK